MRLVTALQQKESSHQPWISWSCNEGKLIFSQLQNNIQLNLKVIYGLSKRVELPTERELIA